MVAVRTALLVALSGKCEGAASSTALNANPTRKVVTMLQMMQNKVTAEGKKEQVLFDKFMCYCSTGIDDLKNAIDAAGTKIPQVESALKEAAAEKAQLEADTKEAQATRAECKEAIATATALREKEAATYAKVSGDYKTNIGAMTTAIAAIAKGAGGFLQTSSASIVKKLSIEMELSSADRDQIVSFLSNSQGSEYAPQSGQITGILQQMLDTMKADLADATKAEEGAIANFDALVAAKEAEIEAATKAVEDKLTRVGNLGVEISTMKEDLDDTQKAMIEDKKFLAELEKGCATKQAEWDERCKLRTEELLALADTIKMLNDDDALELFKKTLPGASAFLQLQVSAQEVRTQALSALKSGAPDYRVDLISLAIKGKKVSMTKVIKMIDDMVALLGKEQTDDDDKKEMCEKELDKAEDDLKVTETAISDLEKELEDTKEEVATLTDEIAALQQGIKDLDKQVEEATVNRKEENEDYTALMASNTAAVELIGMAKNRMNKFYNPSMYKAPPKRQLTEEERITLNMGGTLAPTDAPGGIAGTGVSVGLIQAHSHGAPPPPPETFGAYSKKSEESNGVLAMMDAMVADLEKEMQEADFEEKDSQAEYEQMMKDAAEKRTQDSKSITDNEGTKADDEAAIQSMTEERTAKMKDAMATVDVIQGLHADCDWLLKNFEVRKEARSGEVDALKKAKAVLSGADFS
jgi:predicted  nucleic acid-binding Zn-ribbon protein